MFHAVPPKNRYKPFPPKNYFSRRLVVPPKMYPVQPRVIPHKFMPAGQTPPIRAYEPNLSEAEELGGLLKKLRKVHKKITAPIKKIEKKLMPKPLRKLDDKIEKKVDKLAANKMLNKIGDVAAVAVASYFVPPLAAAAKSALINKGTQAVAKKVMERKNKKEVKRIKQEIAQLNKGLDTAQTVGIDAAKSLPPSDIERLRYLAAIGGPDAMKSAEALELMKPAIVQTAAATAPVIYTGGGEYGKAVVAQAAAEQTEDRVDEASTKDFLIRQWPIFAAVGGGLALLYFMNRRK